MGSLRKHGTRSSSNPDQAWSGLSLKGLPRNERGPASGFTLLEVILALAILGLALATLGQAVGRSHESARRAADESELLQAATSVLDEVLAGVRPLQAIESEGVADPRDPTNPPVAVVSAVVEAGPLEGLLVVRVEAKPNDPAAGVLETVSLTQWIVDPSLLEQATAASEAAP